MARCPFGQENQGIVTNLIKFLINYSGSPRARLAAPRSKNRASWAAIAGRKLSESSGLWRWPVGQRRHLQDGHRAEAHGPVGAQVTSWGGGQALRVARCPHPLGSSVQTGHEQVQLPEGTAVAAAQARLAPDEAADALELLVAEPALVQPAGGGQH